MEKENIEKIMEEYRSEMQKLENSNQEKNFETNKKKLHIERLEEEIKDVDPISEKSLYEEYKKQINEAKRELEDSIKETRTPDEIYNEKKEKEIKIIDNKNCAIKNLTQANMKIDKEINEAQLEYKIIMNKISNFELKYDENHIALNGDEQRELFDKSHKLIDKITDLKEAKTKCEEYLVELKQPSKEVETINSILNGTYDSKLRKATEKDLELEDKKDNTEKEETKVEPTKAEPAKEESTKAEPTKAEPAKTEPEKAEPTKAESAKTEPEKAEPTKAEPANQKSNIEKLREKIENETDPIKKQALMELLKTEEAKIKNNDFVKKVQEAQNTFTEIKINSKKYNSDVEKDKMIEYTTEDAIQHFSNASYGVEFEYDWKKLNITKYLKKAFSKIDFDTKEGEDKFKEFDYADPNIVKILSNNPEQLQEYADFLNGKKEKNEKLSFNLEYDIRGKMPNEQKKDLEEYAFIHRNIAKVKKTPIQAIKFAFKGLLEKFRKVKALPAGNLIKEDDDYTMSDEGKEAYEKAYEQSKSFKESLKVEKTEEKINDNTEEKMNRYAELAKKINDSFDKDIEK